MRKTILFFCMLSLSGVAFAQEKSGDEAKAKEVEIVGEIVDLGCFVRRDARGEEHKACAERCLKNGNPAGLASEDGKVYTIIAPAPTFAKFSSAKVKAAGKVKGANIMLTGLAVQDGDDWKTVELTKFGSPKEN